MDAQKPKIKGLTISQIRKATNKEPKKELKPQTDKLLLKKAIKPEKAFRKIQKHDSSLLLNLTYSTNQVVNQFITPEWFTTNEKADVSVVVPLYKNSIDSLVETWDFYNDGIKVEIIFVDDDCPADSKNKVLSSWKMRQDEIKKPIGKILQSAVTQGWGACCNAGAEKASGKILIFLAPDAKLFPGWLSNLTKIIRKPEIGIVGGMQVCEEKDSIIEAGQEWSWKENKFLKIGSEVFKNHNLSESLQMNNAPTVIFDSGQTECISSSFMAVKRTDFLEWGGFSANIFNQEWSDADFCLFAKEKNKQIVYQANSRIYRSIKETYSEKYLKHGEVYFHNKWVASGRIDALVKNQRLEKIPTIEHILIKRFAAFGDVLFAAAVAPALKKKYPNSKIIFATNFPEVLKGNPWIDQIVTEHSERQFDLFFNLDMTYEYRPKTNFLKAYAESVGVNLEDCKLFLEEEPINFTFPKKYVVIHCNNGNGLWAGRNWSSVKFDQISSRLKKEGYDIVCVGKNSDHKTSFCDYDLRGKTSVGQLSTIIKNSSCFFGPDSFPMHIAQVFDVKGVIFFGSIIPETRLVSKNMKAVFAENLPCLGCHHRKSVPCVATPTCEIGVQECVVQVTVDQMWKALQEALKN